MLHATLLPGIEQCSIHETKLLQIRMTHYMILLLATVVPTQLPSLPWPATCIVSFSQTHCQLERASPAHKRLLCQQPPSGTRYEASSFY